MLTGSPKKGRISAAPLTRTQRLIHLYRSNYSLGTLVYINQLRQLYFFGLCLQVRQIVEIWYHSFECYLPPSSMRDVEKNSQLILKQILQSMTGQPKLLSKSRNKSLVSV